MLKKLLKYDLRSVFRFWWIVALISVGMAVLGGFAQSILYNDDIPRVINVIASIVVFFSYFCMIGLAVLTQVLLFIRFYRNFFTDEGYLTFTLPVKRETLLNSKVLAGFIAMAAAAAVCALNLSIIFAIPQYEVFRSGEFFSGIEEGLREIPDHLVGPLIVMGIEALVLAALVLLLSVLFLYCCITFGSMLVKKGKLFASIGMYYGIGSTIISAMQLILVLSVGSITVWMEPISEWQAPTIVTLILLGGILFLAALCALVYAFTHWMLGRKLNLS
jgi:hypothetical protein